MQTRLHNIEDYNPEWRLDKYNSAYYGHDVFSFRFDCPQCVHKHKIAILMHDGPYIHDELWQYTSTLPTYDGFSLSPSIHQKPNEFSNCTLHIVISHGRFLL